MTAKTLSTQAVSKILREAGMIRSETRPPYRTEGFYLEDGKYRNAAGTVAVMVSCNERSRTLTTAQREQIEREQIEYAELALTEAGLTVTRSYETTRLHVSR